MSGLLWGGPFVIETGKSLRTCKECDPNLKRKRPAPHPGPRCTTHHRAVKAARSKARKSVHVSDNFGITEEEYQKILAHQGGACYICRYCPKPGAKRLSVDHDHSCNEGHDPKKGCRYCVRGLLCQSCNFRIVARLKDDPAAFRRGADYLEDPPARRVLCIAA